MKFSDFWINNNGKKEQLRDIKQGVRKEQLDKKFHALFDAYDVNKDGTLETNELNGIFKGLQSFAGADKVLDRNENIQAKSIFASEANIQDADFQGFVKSVSTASADIVSSKEIPTPDGGKEITTTYKDGTVETISYYPDGDFKFKKVDAKSVQTNYYYTVGKNFDKKLTAQQVENAVKKAYKKAQERAKQNRDKIKIIGSIECVSVDHGTKTGSTIAPLPYPDFKKEYLRQHNVNKNSDTKTVERHDFELSERGKQDVEVRDFVLNHHIETHKAAKEALETIGILDEAGAWINAKAGELWNFIKNKRNGTDEEYQNFYELKDKFAPSYDKSLKMKGAQELAQQHQENYFRGEVGKIDTEKGAKFKQVTEQYQNAQILNTRLNLLKTAMNEVEQYQVDQGLLLHSPATSEGVNPGSHIVKANELLLQYFGGDQEAVDMLLNGAMGDNNSKVVRAIKEIYEETQKMNTAVLGGKSFNEVRADYQNQYKEMYGTDFVPDELTDKVMDAKATGGMVKLAAITIVSILITRSPMMAEINGAIAGSAEATGAAANLMRTLVTKYGQTAVTQGVKFAMTNGTLATDVGLTLLNQVTSERGVDGQELLESAKGSAKYIYFGEYIGSPVAEAVGNAVGKIGLAKGLMNGGTSTTQGAIKTTTLTGDKVFENILNTGKGIGQKLTVNSAKLGTDVAMFSALGIATDGQEIGEAFEEQATFLPKLKIMNHVLEYVMGRVLGGKVGAQPSLTSRPQDARMETAINQSGIKNWTIKEMKSSSGTRYTVVDDKGIPHNFNDVNKLVTAMMERVAKTYETVAPKTQKAAENKDETKVGENTPSKIETAPSKAELETNVSDKIKSEQSQIGGKEVNAEVGKSANPEQPQALNAEVKPEVKPEVKKQNAFVKLEIPETPVQTQQRLLKELETAKSRDDFRRITKEIKELPKTPEYQAVKERLDGEYFQRYNEWKALNPSIRQMPSKFDKLNEAKADTKPQPNPLPQVTAEETKPKGKLAVEENNVKSTKELIEKAQTTNPTENVKNKVISEVAKDIKDEGMRLNTPESLDAELAKAEQNPNVPVDNMEAFNLVINGKIGNVLKAQYDNASNVFKDIAKKYSSELDQLEKQYGNDKKLFAEKFTEFLADKLGVKGIEPKIVLRDTGDADGFFDWSTGELLVNSKLNNSKNIQTMIAHEFVHVMQFKDMIANKGSEAVSSLFMHDEKFITARAIELAKKNGADYKSLPAEDQQIYKEACSEMLADEVMEANKGLVDFAQKHPTSKGSLNEYLSRIYQNEYENLKTDVNSPEYYEQVIENEAYYLGNGQLGLNLEGHINFVDIQAKAPTKLNNVGISKGNLVVSYKSPYANPNTASKESIRLMRKISAGKVKITELDDNYILDIWSRKHYSHIEDTPYIKEYMERFDAICEKNTITMYPGENALRTISVDCGTTDGVFSIGKPGRPAAAARCKISDLDKVNSKDLLKLVQTRVNKDKNIYISRELKDVECSDKIENSTIFVIVPDEGKELKGFDWSKTGTCQESGFGSDVFQANVDENGLSTEVVFPSTARFTQIGKAEILPYTQKNEDGKIYTYDIKIVFVKPIY